LALFLVFGYFQYNLQLNIRNYTAINNLLLFNAQKRSRRFQALGFAAGPAGGLCPGAQAPGAPGLTRAVRMGGA
jgi:hypothetical protein